MALTKWLMMQEWRHVYFSHWPLSYEQLANHVPAPLELDRFEGQAWISVIHLCIHGIHIRNLKPSLTSPFAEINVRTYVTYNGKPGVYFFSLDAPHWSTYTFARMWYRIPYFRADVRLSQKQTGNLWTSQRNDPRGGDANFHGVYRVENDAGEAHFLPAPQGSLQQWLSERYRLYSVDDKQRLFTGEIRHPHWQLQAGAAMISENSLLSPFSVTEPLKPHSIYYSPGVNAEFTNIRRVYE